MEENAKNPFKIIVIVLSIVALVLVGVLFYVWKQKTQLISDLNVEKEQLTEEMVQLQNDYSTLSSNNDSLNVQLDREREKVGQLIDRMKVTDAANRTKIRQYEKELGTLRSIMRNYIVQIDSLNTLNTELRKDAAAAREQVAKTQAQYEELSKTTDQYAKQIEVGSVVKGRGVTLTAINSSNKVTERSSRVAKLKTCLNLVENSIAKKGPKFVYIRVKGPDGILMTGDKQQIFEIGEEQMIFSASREVDYQGSEVEVCIYFDNSQPFSKGVYTVDVYTSDGKLGSADLLLK